MTALRLSLRALRRDWRSGEIRVIGLALIVAVAAVTAVGFFTDRVERAMSRQATELLGADLVIASSAPVQASILEEARRRGLATAHTLSFPSVALAGERTALVAVKAVSAAYPLRGRMRVADALFGEARETDDIPAPGTLWVDARLLPSLGLELGDSLDLGARRFRIARLITYEPDRGGDVFQLAPRVLMTDADVPSTALVTPVSRVRYRLLVAGGEQGIEHFRNWTEARLATGESLQGVRDARPELRAALERAERFLGLAALAAVLLGGAAIAVAARHFAIRQADASAVMRALGASQAFILRIFSLRLIWIGLGACLIGALLGFVAQGLLARLLAGWFSLDLPVPSLLPLFRGVAIGLVALLGFALPPILRLRRVPPLRVLRRDLGYAPPSTWTVLALALAVMSTLMLWQAGDVRLALWVIGGTLAAVLGLGGMSVLLLGALRHLRHGRGPVLRFGLSGIMRRGRQSAVQLTAIGLGIMSLLLLAVVRGDLLSAWEAGLPEDAPNHFVINVQKNEIEALRGRFAAAGLPAPDFHPMVRARLVAVNGEAVSPESYADPRAQRRAEHEFNLSWSARAQSPNPIVAGAWPAAADAQTREFSVEQELARILGLKLGDVMRFEVAGEPVEARITSLRAVEWDSFEPNFFVIASPAVLQDYPATYMTSFHLESAGGVFLADMIRHFPSITILDVRALMRQVRDIMDQANKAVQFVFGFTLLAGLMVLYAAIQATRDERLREAALLRSLGSSRRQVLAGMAVEFTVLGLLSGLLACLAAALLGYALATQVFELDYRFNPWLWLIGLSAGALGVGGAGVLGVWRLLHHPPWLVLRHY